MSLAYGINLQEDWINEVDGDGTATYSADGRTALYAAGPSDPNRAYARGNANVSGGEEVIVTFLARAITGLPQAFIDFPARGQPIQALDIVDTYWREYEIRATIPYGIDPDKDICSFGVGIVLSSEGSCEISNLRAEVKGGVFGSMRTFCAGLVEVSKTGGVLVASILEDYAHTGLYNVQVDSGGLTIDTTTPDNTAVADSMIYPLISAGVYSASNKGWVANVTPLQENQPLSIEFVLNGSVVDLSTALSEGQSVIVDIKGFMM